MRHRRLDRLESVTIGPLAVPWHKACVGPWSEGKRVLTKPERDDMPPVAARRPGAGAAADGPRVASGRACRRRSAVPAPAFRRHAHAGLDRARADHRAGPATDGRTVRNPRRVHPQPSGRGPAGAVGAAGADHALRHPIDDRGDLSVEPDHGDGGSAGPDLPRGGGARAVAARRRFQAQRPVRGDLPRAEPGAGR